MRRWCGSVVILLLLLFLMTGCYSYFSRGIEHSIPLYERAESLDRREFMAYLDTAAVDDWEGVWLMVSHDTYCYLAIERINSTQRNNFYTHRLRTWHSFSPSIFLSFDAGVVVGYLETGLYEDEKRMTIVRGFVNWSKEFSSAVHLDDSRTHIIVGDKRSTKGDYDAVGMKRLFPIRSREEEPYKVRYL